MEYFQEEFLMKIGRLISTPLKVDETTLSSVKGKFAWLCVEVNLLKSLKRKYRLRRQTMKIEYESIHNVF